MTTTTVPVCNKRRSDSFEEGATVEGNNNVTYTPRDSDLILDRSSGDFGLLQQFAAEKVSAGRSCLSLPHETATVTVTPLREHLDTELISSSQTFVPTTTETATAIATTTTIVTATETEAQTLTATAIATVTQTQSVTATVTIANVATVTVTFTPPYPCNPPNTLGCTVNNFIEFCCKDRSGSAGCKFSPPGSQSNGFCFLP